MISLKNLLHFSFAFLAITALAQTKPINKKPSAPIQDGSTVPSLNFEYALNDPFKARI